MVDQTRGRGEFDRYCDIPKSLRSSNIKEKPVVVTADRIEAKYIALVDERGKERAEMFCSGSKSNSITVIRILGKDGLPKVTLQADAEGSYVILEQPDGKHGISLGVSQRSNGMMISDSQGRPIYQCGIYHD